MISAPYHFSIQQPALDRPNKPAPAPTQVSVVPAISSAVQPSMAVGKPSSVMIVADAYNRYKSALERMRAEAMARETRFQLNVRRVDGKNYPCVKKI